MKHLIVTILFLISTVCQADDKKIESVLSPYDTLHILPEPMTKEIDGVKYACVDTEGWRNVMLIGQYYKGLFYWRLEAVSLLESHEETVAAYELKIAGYKDSISLLRKDRKYLITQIRELESMVLKGNPNYRIEKILMWSVILVETVALGALGASGYMTAD